MTATSVSRSLVIVVAPWKASFIGFLSILERIRGITDREVGRSGKLHLHHDLHGALGVMLEGFHVQTEQVERAEAFVERDDLGKERSHVQAFFLEDADGRHHGVLTEVQAEDLGGPAGDIVRNDVGVDGRVHAEGQYLAAGGDALQRLFEGVAGGFDDDVRFAPVGEIGDLFDHIHFVRIPDRQTAFLGHADAERVDLGHGHFGGDVLGKLAEQVADRAKAQDHARSRRAASAGCSCR